MSINLDKIRDAVPAKARGPVYAVIAGLTPLLTSTAIFTEEQAYAIVGLILAVATLGFAVLHGTTPLRATIYVVLLAGSAVAVAYGLGTNETWLSVLGIAGPSLGFGLMAANTKDAFGNSIVDDSETVPVPEPIGTFEDGTPLYADGPGDDGHIHLSTDADGRHRLTD